MKENILEINSVKLKMLLDVLILGELVN
jgi:hypothetical protein